MGRRINKFIPFIFIILVMMLMQSCPNPLLEKIEDDLVIFNSPKIKSVYPAADSEMIDIKTRIEVVFSDSMDKSTTTNLANIIVTDGSNTISGFLNYLESTKKLIFVPEEDLDSETIYYITVKSTVRSTTGTSLYEDYKWTFKTTALPTGSISIDNDAEFTNDSIDDISSNVELELTYSYSSIVDQVSISLDNFSTIASPYHSIPFGNKEIIYLESPVTENEHSVYVKFKDIETGFESITYTDSIIVDISAPSAPTITGSTPNPSLRPTWSWSNISDAAQYLYKLNSSDFTTGVSSTPNLSFTPSFDLSNLSTNTLYVKTVDAAGNTSSSYDSFDIYVNTASAVPPTVSVTSPTTDTTPTWNWSTVTGAGNYRYKLDNSNLDSGATETTNLYYTPTSSLSNGTHTLYVQSYTTDWSSSRITPVLIDSANPVISYKNIRGYNLFDSYNYTLTSNPAVTIYLTASDLTTMEMKFSNNNTTWSAWESYKTSKAWNLETSPGGSTLNGTRTVYIQVRDQLNHTVSTSDTIVFDKTIPTITSVSVNSDYTNTSGTKYTNSTSRQLSFTGENGTYSAINDMKINVYDYNTSAWTYGDYTSFSDPASVTLPTGDGIKQVRGYIRDSVGLTGYKYDYIYLDTTGPTSPSVSVNTTGNYLYETAPKVTWTSSNSDNLSGVSGNYSYSLSKYEYDPVFHMWRWKTQWSYTTTNTYRNLYTMTNGFLGDGSYRFYVSEKDKLGNSSSSAIGSFTVNTSADGITPLNGATTSTSAVPISWAPRKGATFKVYGGTNPTNVTNLIYSGTGTGFTTPTIPSKTTYYWKIVATNFPLITNYSPVYKFTTP